MKDYPSSTLVISTYNWPEALELVLLSLIKQNILPNEVIIADDGSDEKTKNLIANFKKKITIPLTHVWHEDNGFQKSIIMNKAIALAKNDYIIEIDGDIIMDENFIKDHLTFAKKGNYLFGSRVNIQENLLPTLYQNKYTQFNFFSNGIKKRTRTIRIPFLMEFSGETEIISSKLRGCNVSFWRDDFIKINGYNESLTGWGKEDSEMIQRLHNINILGKRLKFAGIVFHIYHHELSKNRLEINNDIEKETLEKKIKFAEKGINQYL